MIQVVILIKLFWLWRFFDKSARECNHNHFCNECNNKEYASELRVSFSELSKNPHGDTILKDPATSRKLFGGSLSKLYQRVSFTTLPFAWISHPIKFTPPSSSDLQYVLLTCFLVFAISILEYWFPLRQHSSGTFPKSEFIQSSAPLIPQHSLLASINFKSFGSRKCIKNKFLSSGQWINDKSYLYLIPNSRNDWWSNISYQIS